MESNTNNSLASAITSMPAQVAADLVKFVNSLKGIPRRGKVKYKEKSGRIVDFNYCLLDDILDKVKSSEKFCFMFNGSFCDSMSDTEGELSGLLLHVSGHIIQGPKWFVNLAGAGNNQNNITPQEKESRRSYAKRYYLSTWFAIATDDDLDGLDEKANSIKPATTSATNDSLIAIQSQKQQEQQVQENKQQEDSETIEMKLKRASILISRNLNKLLGDCSQEELLSVAHDKNELPQIRSASRFLIANRI